MLTSSSVNEFVRFWGYFPFRQPTLRVLAYRDEIRFDFGNELKFITFIHHSGIADIRIENHFMPMSGEHSSPEQNPPQSDWIGNAQGNSYPAANPPQSYAQFKIGHISLVLLLRTNPVLVLLLSISHHKFLIMFKVSKLKPIPKNQRL
jgi:hypothetical protein